MSALSWVPQRVAAALTLTARDHNMERRAASETIAGAVVAGPVVDEVAKSEIPRPPV